MERLYSFLVASFLILALSGCSLVAVVQNEVQPSIDEMALEAHKKTLAELSKGATLPKNFPLSIRQRLNRDPWNAMGYLEEAGLLPGAMLEQSKVPEVDVLRSLAFACDFVLTRPQRSLAGQPVPMKDPMSWTSGLIARSSNLRNQAIANLSVDQRTRVFKRSAEIVKEFSPQEELNPKTEPILKADREFVDLAKNKIDWGAMIASEITLLRLCDPHVQKDLVKTLSRLKPVVSRIPGIQGRILAEKKTPSGWIIFGSTDDNRYDVREPVALIVDLGGNDEYRGVVASPREEGKGVSAILDLAGDDVYDGNDVGLATGRLGCGLIVDTAGNDRYNVQQGGIGVGLAGIGMVVDRKGNDRYTGNQYAIGAAIGGVGAVVDEHGKDTYICGSYGIGLGGPCGCGAIIDGAGDDIYRCGFTLPSGYNELEAPKAKPGDSNFQYDAWGIGIGVGRRLYPFNKPAEAKYALAGGIGIVYDAKGNDQYYASNFAIGCGYFFGIGFVADMEGNDFYQPARYGIASGAHYAMGLFIDLTGDDRYISTGPTYNCGCSWDHSGFLFIDGSGNDLYDLRKSAGPARGDIGSWGIAADLGGNDTYKLNMMPGITSRDGLAAFLDLGGTDIYEVPGGKAKNDTVVKVGDSGLFIDRANVP